MQYLTRRTHPEWPLARQLAHSPIDDRRLGPLRRADDGRAGPWQWRPEDQGSPRSKRRCCATAASSPRSRCIPAAKSVEDAAQLFMKECGSPEPEARREAYRGTSDPGYLNYSIGKLEILKLRDDYKKKMGKSFSLQEFHDGFWRPDWCR
ncbi:MAG: DUF885 family protein [Aliidongia sp.]